MPNYLVVLLLSVSVLLGAFYVNTVERRIIQINEELLQHGNEKMKVKVEFESTIQKLKQELELTKKELTQELESTRKELKQELESTIKELKQELESTKKELKQELESTKKELKQELESTRKELKQEKVELDSTRVQIDVLRKEQENARRDIDLIRIDVNALLEKLKAITKAQDIRTVAFYALLTHDEINPGTRHTIAFDLVRTNIHNSYNHFTGAFTAPIYGVYGFIYTLRMNCQSKATFEVMKNDEVMGTIRVDAHNGCAGQFTTGSIVIVLNIGDTVYVRTHSTVIPSGRIHSNVHGGPHFAGWLIATL